MKQTLNGADLRQMVLNAAASVDNHKQKLNDLNVFPVPDGDTGTNMSMTINTAATDLKVSVGEITVETVSAKAATAMLRGARGNSGVILSLLFRGMARRLKGVTECDGVVWAEALQAGVDAAYKAVMKPAEGTILTVSRKAAEAACEVAKKRNNVEIVQKAALTAAREALENTTNQNPVLKKAGVVDAGGKGWVYVLKAMLQGMRGEEIKHLDASGVQGGAKAVFGSISNEDITFAYCTEFIINRENQKNPEDLRAFLDSIGDSLVLVDDEEIIKVHVHTNDPGKALHEAMDYGSFATVKIENMRLQHSEKVMTEKDKKMKVAKPKKPLGVVSVCAGDGLARVFKDLGVDGIISGGQTMNPSTQDILEAVNKVPAETVFVLPNNKNIIMAAEQVNAISPKNVVVIPSKTVPQGITAMLSFDPNGTVEDNTAMLTEALGTVDTMQITYAARNSDFDGHEIHEGDYLAIYGSALFGTSRDVKVLVKALAEKVRNSRKEYITIYYGADIKEKQAQKVAKQFQEICPRADVNLLSGGQPVYYYLISAE